MSVTDVTREELWAKQHLSCKNIDYAVWERDKSMLRKLSRINGGCSFVVDVYKGCYAYASTGFVDWLGYDRHKIETLENRVIIWSRVFIRMIVLYWKTCKSGWGSSFITSLWNIGMTIVMYIVFVYSMLVVTMCV